VFCAGESRNLKIVKSIFLNSSNKPMVSDIKSISEISHFCLPYVSCHCFSCVFTSPAYTLEVIVLICGCKSVKVWVYFGAAAIA